jgi:hypothetical protein
MGRLRAFVSGKSHPSISDIVLIVPTGSVEDMMGHATGGEAHIMKMRSLKTLGFALALAIGGQTPAFAGANYTEWSPISQLNPREFGLEFTLPQAGNPMPCSITGLFRIKKEADNYQVIVATVMSAAAQGKSVRVYAHLCDWDGASLVIAAMVDY